MEKDSLPLMFIDTASDIKESKKIERKKLPSYLNRIEDIKAMLYYQLDTLCEIKTTNVVYEGICRSLDEKFLTIEIDHKLVNIPLENIEHITILRI